MSAAQPGDRLVEVRCRCNGAVLVLSAMASGWICGVCHHHGRFGRLFVTGADRLLREVPAGELVGAERGA